LSIVRIFGDDTILKPVPLSSSENRNKRSGKNRTFPPISTFSPDVDRTPATKLVEPIML